MWYPWPWSKFRELEKAALPQSRIRDLLIRELDKATGSRHTVLNDRVFVFKKNETEVWVMKEWL